MPPHATTIIAQSSRQLRSHISDILKQHQHGNATFMFSLSSNIEPEALSSLVTQFRDLPNETLGCISAPIPGYNTLSRPLCASVAVLPKETTIPFRSTVPGKAPIQVGRWHSTERTKQSQSQNSPLVVPEMTDWNALWSNSSNSDVQIPELQGLRCEFWLYSLRILHSFCCTDPINVERYCTCQIWLRKVS